MRRLIVLQSDKGGVGKSTFARFLGEFHRSRGTNLLLVDGDLGVGQLIQFLGERDDKGRLLVAQSAKGVQEFAFHGGERDRDSVLSLLDQSTADVVLIDLPANSLTLLKNAELNLVNEAKNLGYSVTMVSLVTPYKASLRDVKNALEYAPEADHVIVRNLGFGLPDDFTLWNESKVRKDASTQAKEIDLPALRPYIAAVLDAHNMSYFAGETSPLLSVPMRSYLHRWIADSTAAVWPVRDLLGITE